MYVYKHIPLAFVAGGGSLRATTTSGIFLACRRTMRRYSSAVAGSAYFFLDFFLFLACHRTMRRYQSADNGRVLFC